MDNSLKTLKFVVRNCSLEGMHGGTQMDVVVANEYSHQPPLWMCNNRNLTFIVHLGFSEVRSRIIIRFVMKFLFSKI